MRKDKYPVIHDPGVLKQVNGIYYVKTTCKKRFPKLAMFKMSQQKQ